MSGRDFSPEHVEALEKILGVKLPENGFSIDIRTLEDDAISDAELDHVAGGAARSAMAPRRVLVKVDGNLLQDFNKNWAAKV